MKTMTATEFKAKCLDVLDHVPSDGLVITKRGKAVARLYPEGSDMMRFYGSIPELVGEDDLYSTGIKWNAES